MDVLKVMSQSFTECIANHEASQKELEALRAKYHTQRNVKRKLEEKIHTYFHDYLKMEKERDMMADSNASYIKKNAELATTINTLQDNVDVLKARCTKIRKISKGTDDGAAKLVDVPRLQEPPARVTAPPPA